LIRFGNGEIDAILHGGGCTAIGTFGVLGVDYHYVNDWRAALEVALIFELAFDVAKVDTHAVGISTK
jgi:hypothetical protein